MTVIGSNVHSQGMVSSMWAGDALGETAGVSALFGTVLSAFLLSGPGLFSGVSALREFVVSTDGDIGVLPLLLGNPLRLELLSPESMVELLLEMLDFRC